MYYDQNLYPQNLGASKLINNRTLNIENIDFGGFVETEIEGAKIVIGKTTLNIESKETYGTTLKIIPKTKTITGYGVGYISSNSNETSKVTRVFVKNSTYISNSN